jgi:hypothetical protein
MVYHGSTITLCTRMAKATEEVIIHPRKKNTGTTKDNGL